MAKRTAFHEEASGNLRQNGDDYILVEHEDGTKSVEHHWAYAGKDGLNKGSKSFSMTEFLTSSVADRIKKKLGLLGKALPSPGTPRSAPRSRMA